MLESFVLNHAVFTKLLTDGHEPRFTGRSFGRGPTTGKDHESCLGNDWREQEEETEERERIELKQRMKKKSTIHTHALILPHSCCGLIRVHLTIL